MLVLVRHGQSEANAQHRLVGRLDSPLTPLGRLQAQATGRAVASAAASAGRPVSVVVSSPLTRAAETAAVVVAACRTGLGAEPPVSVDERAIELDYGTLDGLELRSVDAATWRQWRSDPRWRPPGGESLGDVAERVASLLDELSGAAAESDVVVVSHVSPIKAAVAWALGVAVETSWRMSLAVSSITRIATAGHAPALVSFGETAHLSSL